MTKLSNIKVAGAVCISVVLSAAAGVAHGAGAGNANTQVGWSQAAEQLRTAMLQPGELADFAGRDCPMAVASATEWADGDSSATAALGAEGYELGIRQTLHSSSLGGMAFDSVAMFSSSQGARAAADRVAAALRAGGKAARVRTAIHGAYAYRLATGSGYEYAVVFTAGRVEHSIDVELPRQAPRSFGAELARAARVAYARS